MKPFDKEGRKEMREGVYFIFIFRLLTAFSKELWLIFSLSNMASFLFVLVYSDRNDMRYSMTILAHLMQ